MARRAIRPLTRFEAFKRDAFTCQYCGSKPPAVVLHLDHVKPVASGGSNDLDNLLTSCLGCNQGKAARHLDVLPDSLSKRAEILKEKQLQMREYAKMLRKEQRRVDKAIDKVQEIFDAKYYCRFTPASRRSVAMFLEKLGEKTVLMSADISVAKMSNGLSGFKYFCGVCWSKIREPR